MTRKPSSCPEKDSRKAYIGKQVADAGMLQSQRCQVEELKKEEKSRERGSGIKQHLAITVRHHFAQSSPTLKPDMGREQLPLSMSGAMKVESMVDCCKQGVQTT